MTPLTQPVAGNSKPVKVFHALNNIELLFDPVVSPEYAVAYAYCADNNRLSELFSHLQDGRLPDILSRLPMTKGKNSIACGDWMACVRAAYNIKATDIQHVLEQYSMRVISKGNSLEALAADLVNTLDCASVQAAAATGDTPEAKAQAVFYDIHRQLVKAGVIEF